MWVHEVTFSYFLILHVYITDSPKAGTSIFECQIDQPPICATSGFFRSLDVVIPSFLKLFFILWTQNCVVSIFLY